MKDDTAQPSTELQQWLEKRRGALRLRRALMNDGGCIMLDPSVYDPARLPEPLRTEAMIYLKSGKN